MSRPPRPGEDLPADRLAAFLAAALPELRAELVVEQFPSGHSNLTYLLRLGDHEVVLRRPPFGNRVKTAHDMAREYRVLTALHPVYPVPKPVLFCADADVLGAPFYLMERQRGVILRRELPPGLELSPVLASRLAQSAIDQLAALHRLEPAAVGLADLGQPAGYLERQVHGWIRRYQDAQTDSWVEVDQVIAWLFDRLPNLATGERESPPAIVHNDFKYDNLVLDPTDLTRIVAVLDWEMCTVGHPLLDLGTFLAYWVEADDDPRLRAAAFGPTAIPGSWTRKQLVERYLELTGREVADPTFCYCFGLFKLAVIVQQIYYRFFKGHTDDPRFAPLNHLVGLLGQVAAAAIASNRI